MSKTGARLYWDAEEQAWYWDTNENDWKAPYGWHPWWDAALDELIENQRAYLEDSDGY